MSSDDIPTWQEWAFYSVLAFILLMSILYS